MKLTVNVRKVNRPTEGDLILAQSVKYSSCKNWFIFTILGLTSVDDLK